MIQPILTPEVKEWKRQPLTCHELSELSEGKIELVRILLKRALDEARTLGVSIAVRGYNSHLHPVIESKVVLMHPHKL